MPSLLWRLPSEEDADPVNPFESLIEQAYAAFNRRDIDAVLAMMSETVSWPRVSEGGRALGKAEVRAYWTRQWQEVSPRVDPLEILDRGEAGMHVRVHQLVKNLDGAVLSDGEVWHVYTFADGLIERMDVGGGDGDTQEAPSAAFHPR